MSMELSVIFGQPLLFYNFLGTKLDLIRKHFSVQLHRFLKVFFNIFTQLPRNNSKNFLAGIDRQIRCIRISGAYKEDGIS